MLGLDRRLLRRRRLLRGLLRALPGLILLLGASRLEGLFLSRCGLLLGAFGGRLALVGLLLEGIGVLLRLCWGLGGLTLRLHRTRILVGVRRRVLGIGRGQHRCSLLHRLRELLAVLVLLRDDLGETIGRGPLLGDQVGEIAAHLGSGLLALLVLSIATILLEALRQRLGNLVLELVGDQVRGLHQLGAGLAIGGRRCG